ncbi:MAG: carbamoyltransferase C-terminal domain-containing protein [Rhodothermales bacterium]|nr:carbamoyltransferase C-terminal domain-containing protein [Rhodothermales bacterium]
MKPTYILGINAYHGDVSAVLLRDGDLVAALEEERFRRVKHWAGFPTEAVRRCLDAAGITGADVDHVAISRDPKANLMRKARFVMSQRPSVRLVLDRVQNSKKVWDLEGPLAEALGLSKAALPTVHNVEHHPAHLASAFFVSPFEEAAVCAIDGFGDFVSTSMAVGRGTELEVLDKVYFPHSLGMLYTAITQYLGFLSYGDEFKVMGLAPYGTPRFTDKLAELVTLKEGGRFELNLDYFRHWREGVEMEWEDGYPTLGRVYADPLEDLLGPARQPDEPLTEWHEDMAASLQALHERCAFHVLNGLWEKTKLKTLCLAGGCAMNSVANGKVRANTPFEEVYIQPASADNGTALGAAYYVWHQELGRPRSFVMEHAYWGTEYDAAPVAQLPVDGSDPDWRYTWTRYDSEEETCSAVAKILAEGNVVGWFQGRMEWGARALGNRSILADPRRADMRDLINTKIKFRERFRPFAPSIAEDALHDYFEGAAPDPFMQQVYPVREDKRDVLPAITHVDGSGRLQTVSATTNPRYYRLIQEFAALTGVPVLLNTSFNENEPIVDTPEQALDCFLRTRMDCVVIGDTVIRRFPASAGDGAEMAEGDVAYGSSQAPASAS